MVDENPADDGPAAGSAFAELTDNLDYAREIVQGGRLLERLHVGGFDVRALYRAAWVQAVAALDRWVHRELYERALALALAPSVDRPAKFLKLPVTMALFEDVRHQRKDFPAAFREVLRDKFGHLSFQQPDKIKEALGHVSTIDLWQAVTTQVNAARNESHSINAVKDTLAAIVDRRNHIAHEADRDPHRRGHRLPMTDAEVIATIEWVRAIATGINAVLGPRPERPMTPVTPPKPKGKWSRADLFVALGEVDAEVASAVKRLLDHAAARGATLNGGVGSVPSAGVYYPGVAGKKRSLWSLFVSPDKPSVTLNIASVRAVDEKLAARMIAVARLNPALDAALLDSDDVLLNKYPNLDLRPLAAAPDSIDAIIAALDAVLD